MQNDTGLDDSSWHLRSFAYRSELDEWQPQADTCAVISPNHDSLQSKNRDARGNEPLRLKRRQFSLGTRFFFSIREYFICAKYIWIMCLCLSLTSPINIIIIIHFINITVSAFFWFKYSFSHQYTAVASVRLMENFRNRCSIHNIYVIYYAVF